MRCIVCYTYHRMSTRKFLDFEIFFAAWLAPPSHDARAHRRPAAKIAGNGQKRGLGEGPFGKAGRQKNIKKTVERLSEYE